MKKTLPNVSAPTLVVVLPVSKQKVKYRPFVIREQKALLLAQEAKEQDIVFETIKSVIESCTHGTLDFDKTPTIDVAYFFLQLRIASVGPAVRFGVNCTECNTENVLNMSLDDVKVDASNIVTDIKISDTVGIKLRLPTINDAMILDSTTEDKSLKLLYSLIENIYDEESVYNKNDYTEEEFAEWIGGFNDSQAAQFEKFLSSIPELKHELTFECTNCGHSQSRTLEGLHNFFRFGFNT